MNNDLAIIIDKYLKGEATESERKQVDAWYLSFDSKPGLTDQSSPEEVAKTMKDGFTAFLQKLGLPKTDFNQGSV